MSADHGCAVVLLVATSEPAYLQMEEVVFVCSELARFAAETRTFESEVLCWKPFDGTTIQELSARALGLRIEFDWKIVDARLASDSLVGLYLHPPDPRVAVVAELSATLGSKDDVIDAAQTVCIETLAAYYGSTSDLLTIIPARQLLQRQSSKKTEQTIGDVLSTRLDHRPDETTIKHVTFIAANTYQ